MTTRDTTMNSSVNKPPSSAKDNYAALLNELLALRKTVDNDSARLQDVEVEYCPKLDALWNAMTDQEQEEFDAELERAAGEEGFL